MKAKDTPTIRLLGLEGLPTIEVACSGFGTMILISPVRPYEQKQQSKEGRNYGNTSSQWIIRSRSSFESPTFSAMLAVLALLGFLSIGLAKKFIQVFQYDDYLNELFGQANINTHL